MKKITLILFLLPLLAFGQKTKKATNEEKEFVLKVVKSIIERDCETYYNLISDSVVLYLSLRDTLVAKSDIRDKLIMLCQISVKNDTLDYAYYIDNFDQQFFAAKALSDREFFGSGDISSTLGSLNNYNIEKGDLFFMGANHKTRNRLDFMLDDAFKFLIRKINGEYKIILLTN